MQDVFWYYKFNCITKTKTTKLKNLTNISPQTLFRYSSIFLITDDFDYNGLILFTLSIISEIPSVV